MVLLIDMDDVLEQLVAGWVDYLREKYAISASADDVRDWNIALAFPELSKEQVYSAVLDEHLWDLVKPMPGADEALRQLRADGHEIYIVTATDYETLRAKMEKVLFRYFPYITWDHVIITHNKQMIRGDVLVDDGPHNMLGDGYYKILFDARHNQRFDEKSVGAVRAKDWPEVYRLITAYDRRKKA